MNSLPANQSGDQRRMPADATAVAAILKDMGINEYEQRVLAVLLEFSHRYVGEILDDAKVYSEYAGKKIIDSDDVKLAIRLKTKSTLSNPPPRELMQEIAKDRNSFPLPPIKPGFGLRLPPDRHCLLQPNFTFRTRASQRAAPAIDEDNIPQSSHDDMDLHNVEMEDLSQAAPEQSAHTSGYSGAQQAYDLSEDYDEL